MNEHDSSPASTRDPSAKRLANEFELPTDPYNEKVSERDLRERCRRSEIPPEAFDDGTAVRDPKTLEDVLQSLRTPQVPQITQPGESRARTWILAGLAFFLCLGVTIGISILLGYPSPSFP